MDAVTQALFAMKMILFDPVINDWMVEHDPKALEQLRQAVDRLETDKKGGTQK